MKLIYLASASKGDREALKGFANFLVSTGHCVFAPGLGFVGKEIPEIRKKIMGVCFSVLREWADVLVVFYEGVKSDGIWEECQDARTRGMPVALAFNKTWDDQYVPVEADCFLRFYSTDRLERWLSEL